MVCSGAITAQLIVVFSGTIATPCESQPGKKGLSCAACPNVGTANAGNTAESNLAPDHFFPPRYKYCRG